MTVYVDDMAARFGRMIMCHMVGDTEAELHEMADRIGVRRQWFQGDHYDIAKSKRALAIIAGAVEVTQHQLGCMRLMQRREGLDRLPSPDVAEVWQQARIADAASKREAGR